jgi:uncharacterized protein YbcI
MRLLIAEHDAVQVGEIPVQIHTVVVGAPHEVVIVVLRTCQKKVERRYCNVDGHSVAKERFGKETSTIETVFYVVHAAIVAMQWFGKHVSAIETVFCAGSMQRSYLKN